VLKRFKILIATRNRKKLREIKEILSDLPIEFIPLGRFPKLPILQEDGSTYKENATKKALFYAGLTGLWALADDSGIEVDALGGRPGIFSSTYAGPDASDEENNQKLLKELGDTPLEKRTARYRAAIVFASPEGKKYSAQASCEGLIGKTPRGRSGFGYDPLFIVPRYHKTFSQLGMKIKNTISHRAKALRKIKKILQKFLRSLH
jgi:XTP/dITP diphosphohydrolase